MARICCAHAGVCCGGGGQPVGVWPESTYQCQQRSIRVLSAGRNDGGTYSCSSATVSLLPVAHTMWSETFGVYYMEDCLFGSLSARAAPWAGPRGIGARGIQVSDFVLWPRRICLCCSLWALSSLREQVHASIEQCLNIWAPACRNLRPCSDSQGLAKAKP